LRILGNFTGNSEPAQTTTEYYIKTIYSVSVKKYGLTLGAQAVRASTGS